MARRRVYGSNAERQRAYRKRNAVGAGNVTPGARNVTLSGGNVTAGGSGNVTKPEFVEGLVSRLLRERG